MLTNLLFVLTCLLSINSTLGDVTFAPRTLSAPWSKRWDSNMEFFNYPMKVFFQNGTTGNFRSALIVQGDGDDGNKPINDIWASPDKGISWYLIAGVGRTETQRAFSPYDTSSFSPVLQRPATGIDNNGGIYRIGGRRNDGIRPQSMVFRSADGGLSWKNQGNVAGATPFWPPRDRASIITDNKNQIYILGGQFLNEGDITMTNTAWMSTDLGVHWQELPHTPWRARGSGVLLSYWSEPLGVNVLTHLTGWDGREGERGLTNEIWISANSANSWRRVRTNWGLGNPPFKPRDAANGEITQRGILVLVGGQYVWPNGTYEALNDIWASLDGGYQWGLCNEDLPLADRRDFFMAFDEQGYLFVAGGQDMTSGAKFNDVWRSTISFDSPNTVARECKLPMPACGPGIACLPDDPHTTFLSNGTVTCPRVRKCAGLPEEFMDFNSVTVRAPWSARYWLNAEYLGKSISFTTTRGVTVTYNKPLIVHGGNVNTNDVWASSDHGKSWEIVAGQGAHSSQTSRSYWPARPFATSIVNQVTNQIIRVGGFVSGDAGTTVNDVWVTLDAKIWNKQPATNLPNRAQPHLVVDNAGKLYFSGGILSDGSTGKDLWTSNDNGATWTQLTDVLPWAVQRGRAKGFLLQDRLPHPTLGQKDILFAGTGWDGINVYNDIWASSDYGVNWSRITARAPFGARDAAGAEITEDGLMIVVGGYTDGTQQNDVWVSADGGYSWGACSTEAAWSDRREPTGLVDDEGHFYVMGGRSNAQADAEIFNDVWRSVLSLDNYNAVARACNVKISSCGPGLLCWPGAPDTVITSTGVTCPAAESCGPPKPRSSSSSTGRGRSSSSSKKPTPQPDPDYCEEFPCEDECDPDPDINPECFWSSSSTGPAITTGSGLSMGVIVAIIAFILVAVLGGGYWYYKRRGSTDPMSSSSMELGKAHTQSNNINQSLLSDDQPSSDAPAAL